MSNTVSCNIYIVECSKSIIMSSHYNLEIYISAYQRRVVVNCVSSEIRKFMIMILCDTLISVRSELSEVYPFDSCRACIT